MDIKLVKRDKIMGKGIFDLSGKVALVTAGGHGLVVNIVRQWLSSKLMWRATILIRHLLKRQLSS